MCQAKWTAVDQYLAKSLVHSDSVLERALRKSDEAGLPALNVAPNQGKLLQLLATAIGATRILEIGTLGAYSTIWLARGMQNGGRLITLEYDPAYAEVARDNIAYAGLSDIVEVRVGAALDSLKSMQNEGIPPFDLIFIDADKPNTRAYFSLCLRLSHSRTLIIADNVVRDGEVANEDSVDPKVKGAREFIDSLESDSRTDATAIQTVGLKGHDGFLIAIVK
jgi:predicted O-methyltransferase YrrM